VAKLSNKNLLLIAVVFSLLMAILMYKYLKGIETPPVIAEGVSVIVAKMDIPPKTKITPEMVSEIKVPAEYIQPGAVTSLDKALGVMVKEKIMSGEQISERWLIREGKAVGFTGIIPRDKRAVTVAVSEVTGVAGFVKAGDYVDVVASFDASEVGDHTSQVVLQNILVLAANRETEISTGDISGKEAGKDNGKDVIKVGTVTMAVTPDEAAKLTLADEKGKIRLTLRPYLPLNGIVVTEPVTPKDLVGIHSSPVKNEQTPPAQASQTPAPPVQAPSVQSTAEQPPKQETTAAKGQAPFGIKVIRGTKVDGGATN